MQNKKILALIFYLLFFNPLGSLLYARGGINRIWGSLNLTAPMNEQWFWICSPHLRVRTERVLFDQFLNTSGVGYKFNDNTRIVLGVVNIQGQLMSRETMNEFRAFQQISTKRSLTETIDIDLRSRWEQRHWQNFREWNSRLRNRIQLSKALISSISLVSSDEIFINFNKPLWLRDKTVSQNRLYLGLHQKASKSLTVGAGYLVQSLFLERNFTNHAFAFDVFYHFA